MMLPRDDISDTDDFFEMSLDNLCVAGFDGYFKRVNASWTRTLGWTAKELLARPIIDLVHPDDRHPTLAGRQQLHTGSAMGPLTNRYLCKDGSYRWFEWRSVAHPDRGLVYAAARDVTEQKRSEELLRQAALREDELQRELAFVDRMSSLGTLAAGVAHEINTPLAAVAANIALLIEQLEPAAARSDILAMAADVRDGAERIRKIVGGLKTFARADVERRAVIELRPLLQLAIDLTSNTIRHRARLVTDFGDVPRIDADEGRISQVFINLLTNAAQAIPEGDSATHEIRITTATDAEGRAVVEIRDTGVGIPPALMGRIFDPFFSTKGVGVGTGLGLSICHAIVTGIGGDIRATSELGRGTTFRIVIPAGVRPLREAAVSTKPPAEAEACDVLVVDDEPAIGAAVRRVLRKHHVTVVTAARSALELLEAGQRFDVIFSDLMMPEMSGMDFFNALEARFPAFAKRVVFVSGGAFTDSAQAFLRRVPNKRLDKPFDPEKLRALVRRVPVAHDDA